MNEMEPLFHFLFYVYYCTAIVQAIITHTISSNSTSILTLGQSPPFSKHIPFLLAPLLHYATWFTSQPL